MVNERLAAVALSDSEGQCASERGVTHWQREVPMILWMAWQSAHHMQLRGMPEIGTQGASMVFDQQQEQIDALDEYARYLLASLLQLAEREAGKPLTHNARRQLVADFIAERGVDRKAEATAKRKISMSRKMRDIQAQAKTDFQWTPPVPSRKLARRG